MTDARREELRDETAALFKHGYRGYMKYAYPADELKPISCAPLRRSPNSADYGINDLHANVSLTLLDVLSALPLLHPTALPSALERISTQVSFDQDVKVQVFEMTIRALGGLLSMYQYLDDLPDGEEAQAKVLGLKVESKWWGASSTEEVPKVDVKRYKGRMLELAEDLGRRLLPAFGTVTGIPYARVNLRRGLVKGESIETCTAGAGSLLLEFGVLSRLTGDPRYEAVAHKAFLALWNRRSDHNLLGNTIGATHGQWLMPGLSGVGAGMDSFFEYGIKAAVMLDDDTYMDIFYDSYAAIQTHVRTQDGFIYRPTHTRLLQPANPSTIDSLSAFLPAVQVLAGDIDSAIRGHLVFWNLWRKHNGTPESWSWAERRIEWAGWPGRPEFVESTYYLYQATRDPFYLRVGERVLKDLKRRTKTRCGFATIKDIRTGELEDRMESFMLSETLKYLYLLFSHTPFPNSNKVYTTEGHPLYLPTSLLNRPSTTRRALHKGEHLTCPVYKPRRVGGRPRSSHAGTAADWEAEEEGIVVGVEGRDEYEYARGLVYGWTALGLKAEDPKRMWWDGGVCSLPVAPKFAFDVVLSPLNDTDSAASPEDPSPGPGKVQQDPTTGDYVITNIEGLRLGVRWRLDGKGYDVSSIGPHRVRTGQQVIVTDPAMRDHLPVPTPAAVPEPEEPAYSTAEVILRFLSVTPAVTPGEGGGDEQLWMHALGSTAIFGKDFSAAADPSNPPPAGWDLSGPALPLILPPPNSSNGCRPLTHSALGLPPRKGGGEDTPFVLLLDRGGCTFLEKTLVARVVGAAGVLVVGFPPPPDEGEGGGEGAAAAGDPDAEYIHETGLIRPSADSIPSTQATALSRIGIIYSEHLVGELVRKVVGEGREVRVGLMRAEEGGLGEDGVGGSGFAAGGGDSTGAGGEAGGAGGAGEKRAREGRLGVGAWEICNLLVVDTT
ncbi:hypothetical protein IAT38_003091 [Cryptococcus sp. DSM 104549]